MLKSLKIFLETPLKKSLVLFNGGWGSELYFKPAKELVLKGVFSLQNEYV